MALELTHKDEKIAELLTEAGLKKNTAKVMTYLHKAGEVELRNIERATGLRQPEVSLAMKELKEWGWAKERQIKRKGKGRPIKSYKLTLAFKDIVHEIVDKRKEELKRGERDLAELKKLID